jgi:hypothetical protein
MRKKQASFRDEWAHFTLTVQQELRAIAQSHGNEAALLATRAVAAQHAHDLQLPLYDDPKKAAWIGLTLLHFCRVSEGWEMRLTGILL